MIYLQLFWEFLKVGCFSFGGAYSAIPIIRDSVVIANSWLTEGEFTSFIAICESTPGPIMVNMATYIGSVKGGFLGALSATLGVILPAFLIILLVCILLKKFMKKQPVQNALSGIRPAVTGMICETGFFMILSRIIGGYSKIAFSLNALIIVCVLALLMIGYKLIFKKKLSVFIVIIISAGLGILLY